MTTTSSGSAAFNPSSDLGERAVAHKDERAVAEQAQVARARGRVRHLDSEFDCARGDGRCRRRRRAAREREGEARLASVYPRDVLGGARVFAREYVGEQVGVEELVEEDLDGRDRPHVPVEAPEDLIP